MHPPSKTLQGEYQALPAAFGQAIPRALAHVGEQAQRVAVSVGEQFAEADRRRRGLEEATQAAVLTTEAELKLKQYSFDVQTGQDYNAYQETFQKGAKDIVAETLGKSNNPNVRASVQLRLSKRIGDELLDLQIAKQRKYGDVQIAGLEQHLKNSENLIALSQKPEEVAGYLALGTSHIDALVQTGLLTHVQGVKRKEQFLEGISATKARQDIERDPEAFIQNQARYVDLDPKTRQSLVEHAQRVAEHRDLKADRQRREQEREEEKALKKWQSDNSAGLILALRQGKANEGTFMEMAARRELDENDIKYFSAYFEGQRRAGQEAANRAQRERHHQEELGIKNVDAALGILASTGQLDKHGILAYAKDKNLPARAIDGAVGKAEAWKKAQDSEWNRQHTQAEQLLRSGLSIPSLIDEKVDPSRLNAYAGALDELTDGSKAFGGTEDPIALASKLVQKYRDVLTGDTMSKMDALQGLLHYQTPDALEASGLAKSRPSIYQEQKRLFKQLSDLSKTLTTGPQPAAKAKPGMYQNFLEWWKTPDREVQGEPKPWEMTK